MDGPVLGVRRPARWNPSYLGHIQRLGVRIMCPSVRFTTGRPFNSHDVHSLGRTDGKEPGTSQLLEDVGWAIGAKLSTEFDPQAESGRHLTADTPL